MMSLLPRPYLLKNPIRHYAWGTRREEAFIPRLLGQEPEDDLPYAELWIGSHPTGPSQIAVEGRWIPLDSAIVADPSGLLGASVVSRFGQELPFLLKILSAAEPLSIQAHPNKSQAERLHAQDPEHYPDGNHKPEIAIALDHLSALVGFLPPEKMIRILSEYPEIASFVGESVTFDFREKPHENWRRWITTLIRFSVLEPTRLNETLDRLRHRLAGQAMTKEVDRLFIALRARYPGPDIGLLLLFLMNPVELEAGEALYLPSGVPHAYLKGNIVECMANSDNVVRVGLTSKYKDVETLLEILDWETMLPVVIRPDPFASECVYAPPVDEFRVKRFQWQAGQVHPIVKDERIEILLITEGTLYLSWEEKDLYASEAYRRGEVVLIPASLPRYLIKPIADIQVFSVSVP